MYYLKIYKKIYKLSNTYRYAPAYNTYILPYYILYGHWVECTNSLCPDSNFIVIYEIVSILLCSYCYFRIITNYFNIDYTKMIIINQFLH